jgi:hypothetical protein
MIDVGAPFCSVHTQRIYGVQIKQTSLVHQDGTKMKFAGLFATKTFVPADPIIPYFTSEDIECPMPDISMDTYTLKGATAMQFRASASCTNTQFKSRETRDTFDRRNTM